MPLHLFTASLRIYLTVDSPGMGENRSCCRLKNRVVAGARRNVPRAEVLYESERKPQAKPELPLIVLRTGNRQEIATASIAIRVAEMWGVEEVSSISAELKV